MHNSSRASERVVVGSWIPSLIENRECSQGSPREGVSCSLINIVFYGERRQSISDREPLLSQGRQPFLFRKRPLYIVYQTRYAQFMLVSWYSNHHLRSFFRSFFETLKIVENNFARFSSSFDKKKKKKIIHNGNRIWQATILSSKIISFVSTAIHQNRINGSKHNFPPELPYHFSIFPSVTEVLHSFQPISFQHLDSWNGIFEIPPRF